MGIRPFAARVTLGMLAVATACAADLTGCFFGCGVGAVPTDGADGAAASVSATGVVTFQTIPAGSSEEFRVTVRTWPGGEERVLGRTEPHGVPTTWQ